MRRFVRRSHRSTIGEWVVRARGTLSFAQTGPSPNSGAGCGDAAWRRLTACTRNDISTEAPTPRVAPDHGRTRGLSVGCSIALRCPVRRGRKKRSYFFLSNLPGEVALCATLRSDNQPRLPVPYDFKRGWRKDR